MNVDKSIQEILERTLPVNDNCAQRKHDYSDSAKKNISHGINVIGNRNIIISTDRIAALLLAAALLLVCLK